MLTQFVRSLLGIVSTPPTPSVSLLKNSTKVMEVTAPSVGVNPTNQTPNVKKPTNPSAIFK